MKIALLIGSLVLFGVVSNRQVRRIAEMNSEQIGSLNKEKTVVVLTNPVRDSVNDPASQNEAKIKARQEERLRKKRID
jgi:hypothetical protein